jgi:hypothetical protein
MNSVPAGLVRGSVAPEAEGLPGLWGPAFGFLLAWTACRGYNIFKAMLPTGGTAFRWVWDAPGRSGIRRPREAGLPISELRAAGGGGRCPLRQQNKGDVCGLPLATPASEEVV